MTASSIVSTVGLSVEVPDRARAPASPGTRGAAADVQCVYCLLRTSTKDGSDGTLLHKRRHCQRNSWVVPVHVQIRVQGFELRATINCTTAQYFDGSACQACPTYSSSTGGTSTSCTCAANTFASKSGNTWTCANCTDGATKAAGSVVPGTGGGEKEKDVCTAPPD